jgi:hypothetical protein
MGRARVIRVGPRTRLDSNCEVVPFLVENNLYSYGSYLRYIYLLESHDGIDCQRTCQRTCQRICHADTGMARPKPGRANFGPGRAVADFDAWPGSPERARVLAWLGPA